MQVVFGVVRHKHEKKQVLFLEFGVHTVVNSDVIVTCEL